MKTPDHTASNEIISKFVKPKGITLGQALDDLAPHILIKHHESWDTVLRYLNVVFDKDTEQWVTADEGHPV
jgi:hypothetical protein